MAEPPKIKSLEDFEDPVDYCFYLLGYTTGVRCDQILIPEAKGNQSAYDSGIYDGQLFIVWLFFATITSKN